VQSTVKLDERGLFSWRQAAYISGGQLSPAIIVSIDLVASMSHEWVSQPVQPARPITFK
jgi:hypothetical protein